jgi:hypothetical protein
MSSKMTMKAGRLYVFRKRAGDQHQAGDHALCVEERRTGTFAGGVLLTAHGPEAMGDSEAGEFLADAGDAGRLVVGVTAADLPYPPDLMEEFRSALGMISAPAAVRKGTNLTQGETP